MPREVDEARQENMMRKALGAMAITWVVTGCVVEATNAPLEGSDPAQPVSAEDQVTTVFRADGTTHLAEESLALEEPAAAPGEVPSAAAQRTFGIGGTCKWNILDPFLSGYSIKPEDLGHLVWGSVPSQDCDGIYRSQWGCNIALKVPDGATATVQPDGNIICTHLWWAPGCSWVNPAAPGVGWPACPL